MNQEPDELTVKIYCAMISSRYIGDFATDGGYEGDGLLSRHEALAIEAKRYADAISGVSA